MTKIYKHLIILSTFGVLSFVSVYADNDLNYDGAYLDPAYPELIPPLDDSYRYKSIEDRNDVFTVIENQSPVRSQGRRGTCSIFSATALFESLLIMNHDYDADSINLSEQYLQYMVNAGLDREGSFALDNFAAATARGRFTRSRERGMAKELTLPYRPYSLKDDPEKAAQVCGHLEAIQRLYNSCLYTHFDPHNINRLIDEILDESAPHFAPQLADARREGHAFHRSYLQNARYARLSTTSQIKSLLSQGIPVVMEMDVFYGAWNHGAGVELGIPMNREHWAQGIIGNPEPGSIDLAKSPEKRAGHSVLIVGYDDNRIVTTEVEMTDGLVRTFTYRGVYYFKNSWGTTSFGRDFEIDGSNFPGYGMITQRYANQRGSFYYLLLR